MLYREKGWKNLQFPIALFLAYICCYDLCMLHYSSSQLIRLRVGVGFIAFLMHPYFSSAIYAYDFSQICLFI